MSRMPMNLALDRIRRYERGDHTCDHEVLPLDYLERLSSQEIRNLYKLCYEVLDKRTFRSGGYALVGVGTTIRGDEYWKYLRDLLERHDPQKLHYVDKRGEDIDLILLPENLYSSSLTLESLSEDLDEAGISYVFEEEESENGVSYIPVPPEYIQIEGQGVIRYKTKEYGRPRFNINMNDSSRNFHLIVGDQPAEMKIKDERLALCFGMNPAPFSVLFRSSTRDLFRELLLML